MINCFSGVLSTLLTSSLYIWRLLKRLESPKLIVPYMEKRLFLTSVIPPTSSKMHLHYVTYLMMNTPVCYHFRTYCRFHRSILQFILRYNEPPVFVLHCFGQSSHCSCLRAKWSKQYIKIIIVTAG